ncbi:MAG: hypothetical protein ABSG08_17390, partial [Terriglobales bacterium]
SNCCSSFPRMPSSYQVVLWKQESFVVLRPLHIEFFRNLLEGAERGIHARAMQTVRTIRKELERVA